MEKSPKIAKFFYCCDCDYKCYKQCDYDKHAMTSKHKFRTNLNDLSPKIAEKNYVCNSCNKMYKARNSLWYHQKKCFSDSEKVEEPKNQLKIDETEVIDEKIKKQNSTDALIQYLMKENVEFKQLLIDQNKQMMELAKNTGSHNTTNSHNNFNLNVFLNETCKNAINIMDFVNQLQVGVKELEETGRLGFTDGISKIFIDGLTQLDINNRPVHCSDFKREILYIKSDDQWNKESDDKPILTNAIKHVACKNMKQISEWTKANPDYNNSSSKENDRYLQIVYEAMSGTTEEECKKNYNKIIKNIMKQSVIDKKEK
jgi:hypothetical protein